MLISISTGSGIYTFGLNAALLKLLACVVSLVVLVVGYTTMQLTTFILSATPQQFLRIVLFTAFIICILFLARFLLRKKAGVA